MMEKRTAENRIPLEDQDTHGAMQQLIIFKQGHEEYGIRIEQIKEVVLTPYITKMPHTRDYVKGVANIRGNIIGIIDLEEKLGLKQVVLTDEVNQANNYTLVINSDDAKAGLLVTQVPNTLTVSLSSIEQSGNIVQDNGEGSGYIDGIVKLEDRLIILVDIFKALDEKTWETANVPNEV